MRYQLRDREDGELLLTVHVADDGTPVSADPPGGMLAKMVMSGSRRGLSFGLVARSVTGQGDRVWELVDEGEEE